MAATCLDGEFLGCPLAGVAPLGVDLPVSLGLFWLFLAERGEYVVAASVGNDGIAGTGNGGEGTFVQSSPVLYMEGLYWLGVGMSLYELLV